MGDLIEFPRPFDWFEQEVPKAPEECSGKMHVFVEVPGFCQCRAEYWGEDGILHSGDDEAIGIHYVA